MVLHPLLIDALLRRLRARGLSVGVDTGMVLGHALAALDTEDPFVFREVVKGIVARDRDEAREVESILRELETPAETTKEQEPVPPEETRSGRWWSNRWWIRVGIVALSVALVAALWWGLHRPEASLPPVVETIFVPPPVTGLAPPTLPSPPTRVDERVAWLVTVLVSLLAFLYLDRLEARRVASARLRERWRQDLEAMPRPHTYELNVRHEDLNWTPEVLDEISDALVNHATGRALRADLDVEASLARTTEQGGLPDIVFRARRSARPAVILLDAGYTMSSWRDRMEELLSALARRGVDLEVWRFRGQALDLESGERRRSLEEVSRLREQEPCLLVSDGAFLHACACQGQGGCGSGDLGAVRQLLKRWENLAWITPLPMEATDPLPTVPRFTMSPRGVLRAVHHACGLRVLDDGEDLPERSLPTDDEVDQLRFSLSLLPVPSLDALEYMRQAHWPDAPIGAVGLAWNAGPVTEHGGHGPDEAELRRSVLEVMEESEPVGGTLAHERWQVDRALLGLPLASHRARSVEDLEQLAGTPAALFVQDGLQELRWRMVAAGEEPSGVVRPLRQHLERRVDEAFRGPTPVVRWWRLPSGRSLVLTALIALGLAVGVASLDVGPRVEIPHLVGAFRLEIVSDPAATGPVTLRVRREVPNLPAAFSLYRDDAPHPLDSWVEILGVEECLLPEADRGHWYQVRALLDGGVLATSDPVFVPAPPAPPLAEPVVSSPPPPEAGTRRGRFRPSPVPPIPEVASAPPEDLGLPPVLITEPLSGPPERAPEPTPYPILRAEETLLVDRLVPRLQSALQEIGIREDTMGEDPGAMDCIQGWQDTWQASLATAKALRWDSERDVADPAHQAQMAEMRRQADQLTPQIQASLGCRTRVQLRHQDGRCLHRSDGITGTVHLPAPSSEVEAVLVLAYTDGPLHVFHQWVNGSREQDPDWQIYPSYPASFLSGATLHLQAYAVDKDNWSKARTTYLNGSRKRPETVFSWIGDPSPPLTVTLCTTEDGI